ncbi:MAG: phage major capsid protein [Isosphaeraceae bacterium]
MLNVRNLKRLHLAAKKDGKEAKFFDEFQEGLDSKAIKLQDISIRELAENFIEDGHEAVLSWNPRNAEGGVSMKILEETGAVTSGGFSRITGQLLINAVLQAYEMEENVFSKIIPSVPTQLNGQKVPGISRIGDNALAVGEAQAYPVAGVSEDYIETPLTTKRGLMVNVTKEAIFFDLTGQLQQRCSEVGEMLAVNKEKRIIDCVIDENTTAGRYKWKGTSYATYQSSTPFINLKATNALVDWTNIDAAELVFNQLTDPYTGEPIVVNPKHLVVTRQLLRTAQRILTATSVQTVTPGYATCANPNVAVWNNPVSGYQIVSSAQLAARLGTDTSWYIGDLTKAFKYMENWPITVVQAPSNSEAEFTHDIVYRVKASERGAASTWEPRQMVKSTVA